jgi:hypothetical protein
MMKNLVMLFSAALIACSDSTAPRNTAVAWLQTLTTGGDLDLDGYVITIDGTQKTTLGPKTLFRLDSLASGPHTLRVDGVADNCTLRGETERTFIAIADGIVDVLIEVECDATGVEVTTSTRGLDPPFEGFLTTIGGQAARVPPTGVTVVSRVTPANHSVRLEPSVNCTVIGGNERSVVIEHRKLTPVSFELECSALSKEIVFTEELFTTWYGLSANLMAATRTGAGMFRLVPDGHGASWSPDGKRLAYSNDQCFSYYGYPCGGNVLVIDADTRQADYSFGVMEGADPAWSPDGGSIAYVARQNGVASIVVRRNGTTTATSFVRPLNSVGSPTWSSDGSRIAFSCQASFSSTQVCVMNVGAHDYTALTIGPNYASDPAWSPDGKTIAFVRNVGSGLEIAIMDPDGGNVRRVTEGNEPSWSPDGTQLIFSGNNGLFIVNADGSGLSRLTTGRHRAPSIRP